MNRNPDVKRFFLAALAIWLSVGGASGADRHTVLAPIPDVGEPFDVRRFVSVSLPDDKNAFTSYRPAAGPTESINTASSMPSARIATPWAMLSSRSPLPVEYRRKRSLPAAGLRPGQPR